LAGDDPHVGRTEFDIGKVTVEGRFEVFSTTVVVTVRKTEVKVIFTELTVSACLAPIWASHIPILVLEKIILGEQR
jgi:hypothetical protein